MENVQQKDEPALAKDECQEETNGIIAIATLTFEENLLSDGVDCPRYGCTCINYEKCCGCLLQ
jgi:hypothetical protein